jgi:hypothetical protein
VSNDALGAGDVFRGFVRQLTTERRAVQAKSRRRESTRRMWSFDGLPMARVYMHGPKWRRWFEVREVPIAEIDPDAAPLHRPGRKLLVFTLEEDVRERVCEQLGFDRYAMWSDPRESGYATTTRRSDSDHR